MSIAFFSLLQSQSPVLVGGLALLKFTLNGASAPDSTLFGGSISSVERILFLGQPGFRVTLSGTIRVSTSAAVVASASPVTPLTSAPIVFSYMETSPIPGFQPGFHIDFIVRDGASVVDTAGVIVQALVFYDRQGAGVA